MKTGHAAVVLFTWLLTVSSACKAGSKVNTKGLVIAMSFVKGEHSRDSNSQLYSVSVDGDSIRYNGPHPPCQRGRCAQGKIEFKINKKVFDEAIAAITTGDLTRTFSEEKEIRGLGNYLRVTATVTFDNKTGKTVIKGMSYTRAGAGDILSKAALSRAEAVRMLLIPFRLAGEDRLPKE